MREPSPSVWNSFDHALSAGPEVLMRDVHVLRLRVSMADDILRLALAHLPQGDQAQASRYQRDIDRHRFLAGRIAAYTVLSWWTGTPADSLFIAKEPNGKPYLQGHPDVAFNISHSGQVVLLAFGTSQATGDALGVDVEQMRPLGDMAGLARTAFRPQDCNALLARPAEERSDYFFALWTEQEALLKATGEGFLGLSALHRMSSSRPGWTVRTLWPAESHPAAMACRNASATLRIWDGDMATLGPLLASSCLPPSLKDTGGIS